MDLKAIQAALLFGGQSGPGGDWAEAVCAPFTASGGTVVCSPLAGRALTVAAACATTQAGGGTAAPGNIRALGGVGENGSLTLTAAGGETREVEIPLTGPLYTGDMVALAADGSVTETHRAVKLTVDGSENWISWTNPRDTADITVPGTIGSLGDILCSHYSPLAGTLSSDAGLYTVSTNTTAEPGKTRIDPAPRLQDAGAVQRIPESPGRRGHAGDVCVQADARHRNADGDKTHRRTAVRRTGCRRPVYRAGRGHPDRDRV